MGCITGRWTGRGILFSRRIAFSSRLDEQLFIDWELFIDDKNFTMKNRCDIYQISWNGRDQSDLKKIKIIGGVQLRNFVA